MVVTRIPKRLRNYKYKPTGKRGNELLNTVDKTIVGATSTTQQETSESVN
jgi:hypothetical protein